MKPVIREEHELGGRQVAFIDEERCNQCSLCEEVCRSGAINDIPSNCIVDAIACAGCRLCYKVCPEEAITMREGRRGRWFVSDTAYGPLVHAELDVTEENSGKLVSLVRKRAWQIAGEGGMDWIISDGPSGIGNPVISSLFEAHLALLVTEPTPPGWQGLERVIGICRRYSVPVVVCINKYDINEDNARRIESYCLSRGIDIAARIPFESAVALASRQGLPVEEAGDSHISRHTRALWGYLAGTP
jgi:MinD superfamily P-loop ATPase